MCGSSDRDRLYQLDIDRLLRPHETRRIVDFAPATPLWACLRSRDDFENRTADLMMLGMVDVVGFTDMPIYPDNFFDFFICSHVLEHASLRQARPHRTV